MKVKTLIKKLQKLDPEARCFVRDESFVYPWTELVESSYHGTKFEVLNPIEDWELKKIKEDFGSTLCFKKGDILIG